MKVINKSGLVSHNKVYMNGTCHNKNNKWHKPEQIKQSGTSHNKITSVFWCCYRGANPENLEKLSIIGNDKYFSFSSYDYCISF